MGLIHLNVEVEKVNLIETEQKDGSKDREGEGGMEKGRW
jgi:hypothetical protein